MPYKNDDLQELFQKAGRDYPLRTDTSNWDNVAAKLNTASNGTVATKGSKFLKYAIIFLLLIGGSVIFSKFQFYANSVVEKVQGYEQQPNLKEITEKPSESIIDNSQMPENIKSDLIFNDFNSDKPRNKPPIPAKWDEDKISAINTQATASVIDQGMSINRPSDLYEIIISKEVKQNNQMNKTISINKISEKISNPEMVNNARNPDNTKSAKQVVKFRSSPPKFYGTLYASPEFSMVKFQQIDKPGYKIGVALGYSINNRFDIEIGLQREHINFYSDGKYFDKSALKIKSDDAILESIDGQSKITSVPVTVKYNFTSEKNGHFFTAAGINAVQITHTENYDYILTKNGTDRDRSKKYSSASGPKYFTGIIVSAGYEAKVCNWFSMKAEPYYQIPIQSLGVGKLPVTSFGINVGIVKRLK